MIHGAVGRAALDAGLRADRVATVRVMRPKIGRTTMPTVTTEPTTPLEPTTEPTGRPSRADLEREHATRAAELADLALDDPTGSRIVEVQDRIQQIETWLRQMTLADETAQRRARAAEAAALAQREAQDRALLDTLERIKIASAAARADLALDDAAAALTGLQTFLAQADRLRAALGVTRRGHVDRLLLEGATRWRLREIVDGARGAQYARFRKPLAVLLAPRAEPEAPTTPAGRVGPDETPDA
jgi:hypothetical protein